MVFIINFPTGRFPKPFPILVSYSLCWISQYVTAIFYFKYHFAFPPPFFKETDNFSFGVLKVLQHKKSNLSSDILECSAPV